MLKLTSATPSENPELSSQPTPESAGSKRLGKKIYGVIAAVAIVVIVVGALLIPQGAASIPLTVNYVVGEKMVYNTTMNVNLNLGDTTLPGESGLNNNESANGQIIIDVLGFNDPYYTLNQTVTMTADNIPFTYSTTQVMDKTGCSAPFEGFGTSTGGVDATNPTSDYYLAQLLDKPEVKVGDTVTIPYPSLPSSFSSLFGITGDITVTFKGFQDFTVPAGTYKVFGVDITSNNLQMTYNDTSTGTSSSSSSLLSGLNMNIGLNYEIYYEYGTMRIIQSSMQENASLQSSLLNYSVGITMGMTLNQDVQP
jgi:hypothetical protein